MFKEKTIKLIFISSAYFGKEGFVISNKDRIPGKDLVPSDLKRFKDLTLSHSVIIGRKTWDSIGRKPLSHCQNIIISRNPQAITAKGFSYNMIVVDSFERAISVAITKTVWVIGGAEIFALALPYADFIHQTRVDEPLELEGNIFFPDPILEKYWKQIHIEFFNPGQKETPKDTLRTWYYIFKRKRKKS